MVGVGVRVDHHRDRLRRHHSNLIKNGLTRVRILGIDERDTISRDEHGGVAARVPDHVEVVTNLDSLQGLRRSSATRLSGSSATGTATLTRGRALKTHDSNGQTTGQKQYG